MSKKCIIMRGLSTKHVIPGNQQWKIIDDKRDECWKCSQHILTIFLWSPRIGILTGDKDLKKVEYYKRMINEIRDESENLTMNDSLTPVIAGTHNDWHHEYMYEVT